MRAVTESKAVPGVSLKDVRERCEEVGECWIWQRATDGLGYPIMKVDGAMRLVRRVVVQASGRVLQPRQPVGVRCDDRLCVHPEHVYPSSVRAIAKKAAKQGAFSKPTRGAKIAKAKRASSKAKLTLEQAREIRASSDSGPVLALRYGVNKSLINRIRSGDAWRDYTGNPFAGLVAANDGRRRRA